MMALALLLVVSACSIEKEAQNNMDTRKAAKTTVETTKTGAFTVLGMDCCLPSVVEQAMNKAEGVVNTAVNVSGSTGEVTVSGYRCN